MAENKKNIGPGQPDYGYNNPTGGTKGNESQINPQGPTAGTENYNPDRKGGEQSGGTTDTDQNADEWAARTQEPMSGAGDFGTGPVPANPGDMQDEGGGLNPGASATPGAGVGDTRGQHSFRCADAGFADCRWEVSMGSSDQLWNEIQRHAGSVHGMKSLDQQTRGKIQDVIRVRRAA
jgi:predicted small metal-binding protein